MAGFIVVCSRQSNAAGCADDLRRLAMHLAPDNITPNPPHVTEEAGLAWAVINPVPGVQIRANGVCLGALFGDCDWSVPLSRAPNGSFALLRHDARHVELVTDLYATRTVWYTYTDDLFLASTSQRALVALLGNFEPEPEAVTWMVASGSLGPELGWDRRLHRLPTGTRLRLDRASWELSTTSERIHYEAAGLPKAKHLERLLDGILDVCRDLDLSSRPSVLTLSGGYDSRSLLFGLAHAGKPQDCVTWGLSSSLDDPLNDAALARTLAERYGRSFKYFVTDPTGEPMHDILTRLLKAGEGRSEDLGGYTDGLELWHKLFTSGVGAVIRGDAPGWGYAPLVNDFVTRSLENRLTLLDDYQEGHLVRRLGLALQHMPEYLYRHDDESLAAYDDRLLTEFFTPTFRAALTDIKCAYVEAVFPLLGRQVVDVVAQLPEDLRHCRNGFKYLVTELAPDVPFAQHPADAVSDRYLQWPQTLDELLAELSSRRARDVLSESALDLLVDELERPPSIESAKVRLRGRLKAVVPERVVRLLRPTPRWHLHARQIALRAYIASQMNAILLDDARTLGTSSSGAGLQKDL
jgi:hypothetical protein